MASQLKKTVKPSGGDYTSLEACMNANEQNLVTADKYFDVEIDGTWSSADTSAVTVHNYTTDATRYVNIYTTGNASHDGREASVSGRSNYILSPSGNPNHGIEATINYITISGLEVTGTVAQTAIQLNGSTYSVIQKCVIHDLILSNNRAGLRLYNAYYSHLRNNIVYNFSSDGVEWGSGISEAYIYNNTVYGTTSGVTAANNQVIVKNNLSYNNTTDFSGTVEASSNYNFSKDDTAPGINSIHGVTDSKTPDFVNVGAGAEDFHLQSTSDAINVGVDLSAIFTTDIDGQTRPTGANTWDIGADEYVAATGWVRGGKVKCII